ncbi:MAG TPA: cupredoxin domain-containing protein [Rhodanobacteraceae bacterium]|nr:cupredoxin domain-containing protein [Rhodanobacteraceae bacterium]
MRWHSVAFAVSLLVASVAHAANPATTYRVGIRDFQFQPRQIVVPVHARVTWTNHDEEPHIVTSVGDTFHSSPALDTNDHYSATFDKPGTYTYFCSIHPQMTGTIVVR